MQKKTKVTLAVLVGLSLASVGAGTAIASTPSAPSSPASTISQQSTSGPDAAEAPDAGAGTESAGTEAAGTEAPETGTETESASDGPGGHADAPGVDVNHEGGADEK